jgi:hypothetical protein
MVQIKAKISDPVLLILDIVKPQRGLGARRVLGSDRGGLSVVLSLSTTRIT